MKSFEIMQIQNFTQIAIPPKGPHGHDKPSSLSEN